MHEICMHCSKPITGGNGDYWHMDKNSQNHYGEMRCNPEMGKRSTLAYPTQTENNPRIFSPNERQKIQEAFNQIRARYE